MSPTTNYVTVYDIAELGYREWGLFVLAGGMFAAALVFHLLQKRKGKKSQTAKVFSIFAAIVVLIGLMTLWDYTHLRKAYDEGKCEIVEGTIENYWTKEVRRPKRSGDIHYNYDTYEGFTVNGQDFSYQQDASQAGFHNGTRETLKLYNGLPVRLHVYHDKLLKWTEDRILRVEIAHPTTP